MQKKRVDEKYQKEIFVEYYENELNKFFNFPNKTKIEMHKNVILIKEIMTIRLVWNTLVSKKKM